MRRVDRKMKKMMDERESEKGRERDYELIFKKLFAFLHSENICYFTYAILL